MKIDNFLKVYDIIKSEFNSLNPKESKKFNLGKNFYEKPKKI